MRRVLLGRDTSDVLKKLGMKIMTMVGGFCAALSIQVLTTGKGFEILAVVLAMQACQLF